jgi:NADPH-dependent 2,4-dienoyl-CoA reductase/sulfur reductase-like enzyme
MSKMNVGSVSRALILKYDAAGKSITNEDLAKKIIEIFEEHGIEVKTSASCIAWYKSKMRKAGQLSKTGSAKSIEIDIDEVEM